MNKVIMAHERSPFRSSPDKGRTGGVCSGEISFLHDFPPKTPLNPPLSGGKRVGDRFLPHSAASCDDPAMPPQGNHMNKVIMAHERSSFRPSPDKGRTGGVCSGEIGFFV
jgi:hypothetical protein